MNIVINDSSKLVNIFGKNDENLRLIEKEVSVEIIPHGNTIQISGDKSNLNIAESIILDIKKLKTSVRIKINKIIIPKQKNLKSRPSRKIGKINAKKTIAEPGSG